MHRPALYILAGGQSSRFGSDKARHAIDGVPMLNRIAQAFEPTVGPITVVAERNRAYADLGLPTIGDLNPGLGPLDGWRTALIHAEQNGRGPWIVLCPCDLLHAKTDWLTPLFDAATASTSRAIAFRHTRWEPLLAMIHLSIRAQLDAACDGNQRSVWRFLDSVKACGVEPPMPPHHLAGINTTDQLKAQMTP
jgi:molybdopterin-guanine dinucleotide biosynthesis protein A